MNSSSLYVNHSTLIREVFAINYVRILYYTVKQMITEYNFYSTQFLHFLFQSSRTAILFCIIKTNLFCTSHLKCNVSCDVVSVR